MDIPKELNVFAPPKPDPIIGTSKGKGKERADSSSTVDGHHYTISSSVREKKRSYHKCKQNCHMEDKRRCNFRITKFSRTKQKGDRRKLMIARKTVPKNMDDHIHHCKKHEKKCVCLIDEEEDVVVLEKDVEFKERKPKTKKTKKPEKSKKQKKIFINESNDSSSLPEVLMCEMATDTDDLVPEIRTNDMTTQTETHKRTTSTQTAKPCMKVAQTQTVSNAFNEVKEFDELIFNRLGIIRRTADDTALKALLNAIETPDTHRYDIGWAGVAASAQKRVELSHMIQALRLDQIKHICEYSQRQTYPPTPQQIQKIEKLSSDWKV
jgi:hypothetical protein